MIAFICFWNPISNSLSASSKIKICSHNHNQNPTSTNTQMPQNAAEIRKHEATAWIEYYCVYKMIKICSQNYFQNPTPNSLTHKCRIK
jgi:hypothetical protein